MRQKDIDLLQFQDPTTSLQVQSTYTPWWSNPRVQDTSPLHNRTKFLSTAKLEIQYETKLCAPGLNVRSCSRSTRETLPWNFATLTMKFRTIIPQLIFPLISEGICPPQTVFLQNECYKQLRGSQRMINYPASLRGFNTGVLGIDKEARVLHCILLLITIVAWRSNLLLDLSVSCTRIVVRHRDSSNSAIPVSNFHFPEVLKFRKLAHDWKFCK